MESRNPLRWISSVLVISCVPATASAELTINTAPIDFVLLTDPLLLTSAGLALLVILLGWYCIRLKHQNIRNQNSAVSALSTMRALVGQLQQNEAALRHQVIEQTAELAQIKAHPGQLTLKPSVVALAKSSAQ